MINKKLILIICIVIILIVIGYVVFQPRTVLLHKIGYISLVSADPKNATYIIEGQAVTLENGISENSFIPGSASKVITKYFGNSVRADFNNDGIKDIASVITQNSGGTGTFFYVAAVISSGKMFKGTNAILLGDRIAPQSTEFNNGEIIVNYADRGPNQPMSAAPTIGVSKYFKVISGKLVEVKK